MPLRREPEDGFESRAIRQIEGLFRGSDDFAQAAKEEYLQVNGNRYWSHEEIVSRKEPRQRKGMKAILSESGCGSVG